MSEEPLDWIGRALGNVEGQMKILVDGLRAMVERAEVRERDATEHRQLIRQELADASRQIASIEGKLDVNRQEIANLKPLVIEHERQRQRLIGMQRLMALLWSALVAAVTAIGYLLKVHVSGK